jgi:hypothetical protein
MQDSSWISGCDTGNNPFAAASNLGRKRDADESGMDVNANEQQQQMATLAHATQGVMPLPKRRIVSGVPIEELRQAANRWLSCALQIHTDRRQCPDYGFLQWNEQR